MFGFQKPNIQISKCLGIYICKSQPVEGAAPSRPNKSPQGQTQAEEKTAGSDATKEASGGIRRPKKKTPGAAAQKGLPRFGEKKTTPRPSTAEAGLKIGILDGWTGWTGMAATPGGVPRGKGAAQAGLPA